MKCGSRNPGMNLKCLLLIGPCFQPTRCDMSAGKCFYYRRFIRTTSKAANRAAGEILLRQRLCFKTC